MGKSHRFVLFHYWFCIQSIICFIMNYVHSQSHHHHHHPQQQHHQHSYHQNFYYNNDPSLPYKCSRKLEDNLDSTLHRNRLKFGTGRTRIDVTPYSRYHALYGNRDEFESYRNEKTSIDDKNYSLDDDRSPATDNKDSGESVRGAAVSKIEVAEMRVRLPTDKKQPWVVVDKCQFNSRNRTLDTRLVFPDLTISGRVILHPSGGYCNMILRLRRAGIEFKTTPLTFPTPSHSAGSDPGRSRPASVRTDSHFSEPGFLSVFAHGCQGPTGIKFRKNSKRNQFNRYPYTSGNSKNYDPYDDYSIKRSGLKYRSERRAANSMETEKDRQWEYYGKESKESDSEDLMNFNDNTLDNAFSPDEYIGRTFGELFSSSSYGPQSQPPSQPQPLPPPKRPYPTPQLGNWYNAELANSNDVNEALTRELEQLFSIGVRGLLTTYMQKALQPAIKETLMENMGYVLSYG